jgi:hypothetical protein
MNQVSLAADGTLLSAGKPPSVNPLALLGQQVQLSAGCTLRSWFRMIERHAPFADLGEFFPILRGQYERCPAEGCQWPEFTALEFAKVVEMIGFPGQPRLEIYNAFQGIAEASGVEIRHLPMEVLLDMPLRLGKLRHMVFGDRLDTFTFDTVYTLFEFIDGIAWELSFHGAPPECQLRS